MSNLALMFGTQFTTWSMEFSYHRHIHCDNIAPFFPTSVMGDVEISVDVKRPYVEVKQ